MKARSSNRKSCCTHAQPEGAFGQSRPERGVSVLDSVTECVMWFGANPAPDSQFFGHPSGERVFVREFLNVYADYLSIIFTTAT